MEGGINNKQERKNQLFAGFHKAARNIAIIFESRDPQKPWGGICKAEPMKGGLYVSTSWHPSGGEGSGTIGHSYFGEPGFGIPRFFLCSFSFRPFFGSSSNAVKFKVKLKIDFFQQWYLSNRS